MIWAVALFHLLLNVLSLKLSMQQKEPEAVWYPMPPGPETPADLLSFQHRRCLNWNKSAITDFRLVCLAAVDTEVVRQDELGWIVNDTIDVWLEYSNTAGMARSAIICVTMSK